MCIISQLIQLSQYTGALYCKLVLVTDSLNAIFLMLYCVHATSYIDLMI